MNVDSLAQVAAKGTQDECWLILRLVTEFVVDEYSNELIEKQSLKASSWQTILE